MAIIECGFSLRLTSACTDMSGVDILYNKPFMQQLVLWADDVTLTIIS